MGVMTYWMGHLWVGHLSLNGQGIYHLMGGALWFNGWDTYGLNGWGSYDKVSCCFIWEKCWSSGEYPFRSSHDHRFRSL